MADRSALRTKVFTYLGTRSTDPFYKNEDGSSRIDGLLQDAYNAIVSDILLTNPEYLQKVETLTSADHTYALPADFAGWIDVRLNTSTGTPLTQCDMEFLPSTFGTEFAISGPDQDAVLTTSGGVEAGVDLYLLYRYWPLDWTQDTDSPDVVPSKFHDVVALDAAEVAFALGGEQVMPPKLVALKEDRRASLLLHVGRRGVQATTARGVPFLGGDWV